MSKTTYTVQDLSADCLTLEEFQANYDAEAREYAEWWQRDVYMPTDSTYWVDVRLWRGTAASVERLLEESYLRGVRAQNMVVDEWRITIDPEIPDCLDGDEHDWKRPYELVGGIRENPGVWGHGGGVIIDEVCVFCSWRRTTDTWAQGPHGEQGLRSVRYEKGEE